MEVQQPIRRTAFDGDRRRPAIRRRRKRDLRAFDQDTGKVLWETNLGSPVDGFPVTYTANGKQYVAVITGTSLVSSGVSRLAPELNKAANRIYVFALPAR